MRRRRSRETHGALGGRQGRAAQRREGGDIIISGKLGSQPAALAPAHRVAAVVVLSLCKVCLQRGKRLDFGGRHFDAGELRWERRVRVARCGERHLEKGDARRAKQEIDWLCAAVGSDGRLGQHRSSATACGTV